MTCRISAGLEPASGILGCDRFQGIGNGGQQSIEGASLGRSQELFDLRPHLLDRIEVRAIGWKEPYVGPGRLDRRKGSDVLMSREIVEYDDVAWPERGKKNLPHVLAEDLPGRGPVDSHARRRSVQSNRGDHGRRTPVSMRRIVHAAPAPLGPASPTGHVRLGPGFIEEHEPGQIERVLRCLPLLASPLYVGSVLLARS